MVARGWGTGRDEQAEPGGFGGAVKQLCMTLSWGTRDVMHLSKPIEYTTPGVSPKVNDGLFSYNRSVLVD